MRWFIERDMVNATRAAMMRDLLDAPFRVIEFTLGGTCAHGASEEIAGVAQRAVGEGLAIPPRRLEVLPTRGASVRRWQRERDAAMVNRLVHKVETVESQSFETVGRLPGILREAKNVQHRTSTRPMSRNSCARR